MSCFSLRRAVRFILVYALLSSASESASATESVDPIRVTHTISIRNGNWIPLPVQELRHAAGDAALSRLTDAGRLHLVEQDESGADLANFGSLAL